MTLRLILSATCVGALLLAGCQTMPPQKLALNAEALEKVQANIKQEVGIYLANVANASKQRPDPSQFWCGSGDIDFDISSVKADLTVTNETIKSAGITAKIPSTAVTIGPSGKATGDATNTQELIYNLWPLHSDQQSVPFTDDMDLSNPAMANRAPIAYTLWQLRKALIESAKKTAAGPQACFTDYNPANPAGDAGNTARLGLSFVSDQSAGLEFSVSVLDITDSIESKGTTGNTLTVSFVQRDLAGIQNLKNGNDKFCAFPYSDTLSCKIARGALHLVTAPVSKLPDERKKLEANVATLCAAERKAGKKAKAPPAKDSSQTDTSQAEPKLTCQTAKGLQKTAEAFVGHGIALTAN
ncbi:MAG TPA: hypothetical protein VM711_02165 [Sphingomicrobium sp.]|nr:hypothetical protein [Sphingomicrobium sp.]